jgi:polyisoprenyl-phosphate glycosyltransferase
MTHNQHLSLLSVVIPVYQCARSIEPLYERLRTTLEALGQDFELIFVDDSSLDRAWERIKFLSQGDTRIKAIQLAKNGGQMAAIRAGLEIAGGDWTLVMDCDLQDTPELIPEFFKAAKTPVEIVFARYISRKDSYWRRLASRLYFKILGVSMLDKSTLGTFSLFSRRARQAYLASPMAGKAYIILFVRLGLKTALVDCRKNQREIGDSSYTIWKLVKVSLRTILLFRPILFMSLINCLLILTIAIFVHLEVLSSAAAWLFGIVLMGGLTVAQLIVRNSLQTRPPPSIIESVNLHAKQSNFID